jgi:hypothetical protein
MIVIFYILFSLWCSFGSMREPSKKAKEAFKEGFLVLPILLTIVAGFIGIILLIPAIGLALLVCVAWLISNMP